VRRFNQVNGQTKIVDVVPTIAALASVPFFFAATADLSTVMQHDQSRNCNEIDGNLLNNDLEKLSLIKRTVMQY
jgi:hypothetical protein